MGVLEEGRGKEKMQVVWVEGENLRACMEEMLGMEGGKRGMAGNNGMSDGGRGGKRRMDDRGEKEGEENGSERWGVDGEERGKGQGEGKGGRRRKGVWGNVGRKDICN